MKNKGVLFEMGKIYGATNKKNSFIGYKDWMNFKITTENYVSYHHIYEKRNGGLEDVENGAILSKNSHALLHEIERINPKIYNEWQELFRELNNKRKPLNQNDRTNISILRKKTDMFLRIYYTELERKKREKKKSR